MSNYRKILSLGYSFVRRTEKYAVDIINPAGETKRFGFSIGLARTLYFGPDKLPITELELINDIFHLSAEEICFYKNNYSLRTEKYFNEVKKRIGFIGHETISDGHAWAIDFEKTKYYHTETHSGIDDYGEVNYYFDHSPSLNDIKTAKLIVDVQIDFHLKRCKETFKCWECGNETHWLDVKGNFFEKVDCLYDRYCGC